MEGRRLACAFQTRTGTKLSFYLPYAARGGGPMSADLTTGGPRQLGGTMRGDAWWLELFPVIALLGAFGVYATLRAFEGTFYEWGPYLPYLSNC
jgi:hypothetical protein